MILREPILKPAAYLVVFKIGTELLLDEFLGIEFGAALKFTISAGTLILFVIYAHLKPLHLFQPVFNWVAEGMANLNELLDWFLIPVVFVVKTLFKGIAFIIRPIIAFFSPKSVDVFQKDETVFDTDCEKKKKSSAKSKP
jgi:hypothetical protein